MKASKQAEEIRKDIKKILQNKDVENLEKELSLYVVNEIIKVWDYVDTYLADLNGQMSRGLRYWYEVEKYLKQL